MKRIAILFVLASITTGCASLTKGGARGPTIQRTADEPTPSQTGELDARPELGQR